MRVIASEKRDRMINTKMRSLLIAAAYCASITSGKTGGGRFDTFESPLDGISDFDTAGGPSVNVGGSASGSASISGLGDISSSLNLKGSIDKFSDLSAKVTTNKNPYGGTSFSGGVGLPGAGSAKFNGDLKLSGSGSSFAGFDDSQILSAKQTPGFGGAGNYITSITTVYTTVCPTMTCTIQRPVITDTACSTKTIAESQTTTTTTTVTELVTAGIPTAGVAQPTGYMDSFPPDNPYPNSDYLEPNGGYTPKMGGNTPIKPDSGFGGSGGGYIPSGGSGKPPKSGSGYAPGGSSPDLSKGSQFPDLDSEFPGSGSESPGSGIGYGTDSVFPSDDGFPSSGGSVTNPTPYGPTGDVMLPNDGFGPNGGSSGGFPEDNGYGGGSPIFPDGPYPTGEYYPMPTGGGYPGYNSTGGNYSEPGIFQFTSDANTGDAWTFSLVVMVACMAIGVIVLL